MNEKIIFLKSDEEYITLQSLLKITDLISSGGMAKIFLQENDVKVNNTLEKRRGRKLYQGDKITLLDTAFIIKKDGH